MGLDFVNHLYYFKLSSVRSFKNNQTNEENVKNIETVRESEKIARGIGDAQWGQGNTKHALEAWEASDITPAEILELAKKLLVVPEKLKGFEERDSSIKKMIYGIKTPQGEGCQEWTRHSLPDSSLSCAHSVCATRFDFMKEFHKEVCEELNWNKVSMYAFFTQRVSHFQNSSFYEAAAVACLKLIKRIA